jgi:DEAD/DEAH box helicase domain-containing protein
VVTALEADRKRVSARRADVAYYTRAVSREETEVIEEVGRREISGATVHEGRITIRYQVVGYERRGLFDGQRISRHPLRMPEYVFESEGLWMKVADEAARDIEASGFDLGGTLHAFEHAAISCIPLFALCDKGDIGGISYTHYPAFGRSAIFIYDGQEGGVGLARRVFDVIARWLDAVIKVIGECPCEAGCPSCVQDPMCGSGNQPLDKAGALYMAGRLSGKGRGGNGASNIRRA